MEFLGIDGYIWFRILLIGSLVISAFVLLINYGGNRKK